MLISRTLLTNPPNDIESIIEQGLSFPWIRKCGPERAEPPNSRGKDVTAHSASDYDPFSLKILLLLRCIFVNVETPVDSRICFSVSWEGNGMFIFSFVYHNRRVRERDVLFVAEWHGNHRRFVRISLFPLQAWNCF
jgi:hypothetical protein